MPRLWPLAVVLAVAAPAFADDKSNSSFSLSKETSSSVPAARARALVAQGKCEDALDAFDEALRHTNDPVLFRERGLCHDKLDHRFPAIDDYRAYLTSKPNASDADRIRARLNELEAQVPVEQRSLGQGGDYELEMRGGVGSLEHGRRKASDDEVTAHNEQAADGRPLREIEETEKNDRDSRTSPLRDGQGPILGFFGLPRGWTSNTFGVTQSYGLALRYSFGAVSSVISEIGYENAQSTGTSSQLGGVTVFAGYEARISLDHWASNHIVLGLGLGYEHLKQGSSGLVYSTFVPRGRIGYRHVFGRVIGLELTADGGVGLTRTIGGDHRETNGVIGGSIALLVGF